MNCTYITHEQFMQEHNRTYQSGIYIPYVEPMYNVCTCMYMVRTRMYNVYTLHDTVHVHPTESILMKGRRLLCRSWACTELRLAGVARPIGPDEKWSVAVKMYIRLCTMFIHIRYIHEHVCTMYMQIYRYSWTCKYHVHTIIFVHVHVHTRLWKFVIACTCTYHVCTWFRHVCTGLTIYARWVGFQMYWPVLS